MSAPRIVLLVAALALVANAAGAQEARPTATVVVRQVAGANLYLDVGRRHGLETGDTLEVARTPGEATIGRLVVTAATDTRAVLAFVGDPFPVTRGASLTLTLRRAPAEAVPEPASPRTGPPTARSSAGAAPFARSGRAHGRVGLDLTASRSVTEVGSVDPERVERTFATPAFRFDVTAPEAVGGLTLHAGGRLAYRYADGATIAPATSVRIYDASLGYEAPESPLRLLLGRFHSPVEAYSGYWDGVMARVGNRGVGVGVLVGFEPDRWNEKPSADVPKVSAVVDWMRRGPGWRWSGDVSAHTVRPGDSLPAHTFMGVSQRVSVAALRVSQDLQMDRDPADGSWRLSRAAARATLSLGRHVDVRAGASRRESWLLGTGTGLFAPRSDRLEGGVAVRGRRGYVAVDASRSTDAAGRRSDGIAGSAAVRELPGVPRVGLGGIVSRWTGPYGNTLSASPSLDVDLPSARLRIGYRLYRADFLERVSTTHGAEASLDVPFPSGVRLSVRARTQWGSYLSNQSVDVSLYRVF